MSRFEVVETALAALAYTNREETLGRVSRETVSYSFAGTLAVPGSVRVLLSHNTHGWVQIDRARARTWSRDELLGNGGRAENELSRIITSEHGVEFPRGTYVHSVDSFALRFGEGDGDRVGDVGIGRPYTDREEIALAAAVIRAWDRYLDHGLGIHPTHIIVEARIERTNQTELWHRSTETLGFNIKPMRQKIGAARLEMGSSSVVARWELVDAFAESLRGGGYGYTIIGGPTTRLRDIKRLEFDRNVSTERRTLLRKQGRRAIPAAHMARVA